MSTPSTELRQVRLQGPLLPGTDDPFWSIDLNAPYFGLDNVPKQGGLQEDRVYPVRTITLDVVSRANGKELWRKPRLLSQHVIGGHSDEKGYGSGDSSFKVHMAEAIAAKKGRGFRTGSPDATYFHHVVASPLLEDDEWPVFENTEIALPPCRLVQGAIPLWIAKDQLTWVGTKSGISLETVSGNFIHIVLVPEGIEVEGTVPFPYGEGKLSGRFLLAPSGSDEKQLVLTLLSTRLGDRTKAWNDAWDLLWPATKKQELAGLRMELRAGEFPPEFSWQVTANPGTPIVLAKDISVPGPDVLVRLHGPAGANGIDGEVEIKPKAWILSPKDNAGALKGLGAAWKDEVKTVQNWPSAWILSTLVLPEKDADQPSTALKFTHTNQGVEGELLGKDFHELAHDEVRLAASLRAVHGLPETAPGEPDPERPLLSAFVPLDDGWLQYPVPNFPMPDPAKDSELAKPGVPAPPNVLSGFVRYAAQTGIPAVLSAFGEPFSPGGAPWSLTVVGAQQFAFAVALDPGKEQAMALLPGPALSTRGLLWISADRPDDCEAIARLGAGSGAYLDVPLETYDVERSAAIRVNLRQLAFSLKKGQALQRTRLRLDIGFDPDNKLWTRCLNRQTGWLAGLQAAYLLVTGAAYPKPVRNAKTDGFESAVPLPAVLWQRHPRMPLASLMPMTRSASSSVRPLESRDLLPFVIDPQKNAFPLILSWLDEAAVFPVLELGTAEKLVPPEVFPLAAWPWPRAINPDLAPHGIALAAFGVPGAELIFNSPGTNSIAEIWGKFQFALRFDLPALDEAFATSTLPPVPEDKDPQSRSALDLSIPSATALDWPAMKSLWNFQEKRHHLARVAHSHLDGYQPMGASKTRNVHDLVGGAVWSADLGFEPPSSIDADLPYGKAVMGAGPVDGNEALLGFSGDVDLEWAEVGPERVAKIVGFSPPSILEGKGEDGLLLDARGAGISPIRKEDKGLIKRSVRIHLHDDGEQAFDLVTLSTEIPVRTSAGNHLLSFWFKDLAFRGDEMITAPEALDPAAWQDGHLHKSGFEWRLWSKERADDIPEDKSLEDEVFEIGRHLLPFFGFALEPLRLLQVRLAKLKDLEPIVIVRCRLHLGQRVSGPEGGGNLVDLTLRWSEALDSLEITGLDPLRKPHADENTPLADLPDDLLLPLRFFLKAREKERGRDRDLELSTLCQWKGGAPTFRQTSLSMELLGSLFVFGDVGLKPAADVTTPVKLEWETRPEDKEVVRLFPGEGWFGVEKITADIFTFAAAGTPVPSASVRLDYELAILPALEGSADTTAAGPALRVVSMPDGTYRLSMFGQDLIGVELGIGEERGGVSMSCDFKADWIPGLTGEGEVSLGLVASIGTPDSLTGRARLLAGSLNARWLHKTAGTAPIPDQSIVLEATSRLRASENEEFITFLPSDFNVRELRERLAHPAKQSFEEWLSERIGDLFKKNEDLEGEIPALRDKLAERFNGLLQIKIYEPARFAPFTLRARTKELLSDFSPLRNRLLLEDALSAALARAESRWIGGLTLNMSLALTSAIRWPRVSGNKEIPWPHPDKPDGHGRLDLTFERDPASRCLHKVTYLLQGHRMSCSTAAGLAGHLDGTIFPLAVAAFHTLHRESDETPVFKFSGFETIAIGTASSLIPAPDETPADSVAFGARYRDKVVNGRDQDTIHVPGMIRAGRGSVSTVLSGVSGYAFRAAFLKVPATDPVRKALMLIGGFAGFLPTRKEDQLASPLVRLPVLAPLSPGDGFKDFTIHQSAESVQVAWADGTAALDVVVSQRAAVAPASTTASALRSALLSAPPLAGMTEPVDLEMAILVEQSFQVDMDARKAGDLGTSIFFPAAAVSLSHLMARTSQAEETPVVISLLAGTSSAASLGSSKTDKDLSTFAASLISRWKEEPAYEREHPIHSLATVGEDLVLGPWTTADGESPAIAAARAHRDHPKPLIAFSSGTTNDGQPKFASIPLPRPPQRARYRDPVVTDAFPDPGRGYPLPPGKATSSWLRGAEEGPMTPFRNDETDRESSLPVSGLAGLSRSLGLPRQAGSEAPVWIAETRAAVYHPLGDLRGFMATSIPWLSPGQPRPRHPVDGTLQEAITSILNAPATGTQWILPKNAISASCGDRAGILLARTLRLETAFEGHDFFDAVFPRFGRPAQGGMWSVRTERTPRPGPLPPNIHLDSARRPCASRLQPTVPLGVVWGPTDTLSGEGALGTWVARFTAAPDWNGMISDSFDGTIPVNVEIDLQGTGTQGESVATRILHSLLMPESETSGTLQTLASLHVGDSIIPMLRVFRTEYAASEEVGFRRFNYRLVFDARSDVREPSAGPAMPEIFAALETKGPLPSVELRLTLQPDSGHEGRAGMPAQMALSRLDPASPVMPHGGSGPPVTLQIRMNPVTRSRGSLPLVPVSLLFIDPAYDASLGSDPHMDQRRVDKGVQAGKTFTLYADRSKANRKASVVFMASISPAPAGSPAFELLIAVTTREGIRRDLIFGNPGMKTAPATLTDVALEFVYELPLGLLFEKDISSARLEAGDMLELTVSARGMNEPDLSRTVRILLTNEPIVEPPPALYAALLRKKGADGSKLSLPLYAQSPLPHRVTLRNAKAGFLEGYLRRSATFVWTLYLPATAIEGADVHVVKMDRNGQAYFPASDLDFIHIQRKTMKPL